MARKKNILVWDEETQKMIPQTVPFTPEEEAEADRQEAEEEARRRQEPPTELETLEAQMAYTAMMTDTLLEG